MIILVGSCLAITIIIIVDRHLVIISVIFSFSQVM